MGTKGFPLIGLASAGSRPGKRPTFLRRQESRQRRRPRFTGRRLRRRLPCAAHNRRPAQNSPAARAQTAAPDFPACCSADQRFRRGFPDAPSLYRGGLCEQRTKILTGSGRQPHSPLPTWHFLLPAPGAHPYHPGQIDRQHLQHGFRHAPHAPAPGRPAPQPRHRLPESHRPGLRWHRQILRWRAACIACRRAANWPCRSALATRRPKILYRHSRPGWHDAASEAWRSDLFSCHAAIFSCLSAIA